MRKFGRKPDGRRQVVLSREPGAFLHLEPRICQTPPQPARRHVGWLGPMRIRWPFQEVNRNSNQLPMADEAATMRGRTQAHPHQVRGPDMVI